MPHNCSPCSGADIMNPNTTAMINGAIFIGIRNAMMEEQYKIPVNSGLSEKLIKVNHAKKI